MPSSGNLAVLSTRLCGEESGGTVLLRYKVHMKLSSVIIFNRYVLCESSPITGDSSKCADE